MSKIIFAFFFVLLAGGFIIVMQGVGVELPGVNAGSACYDMLNAAGQVVQVVCP